MPQPTIAELSEVQTRIQKALLELRSIQRDVTSNPELDRHIGKAYAHLSKGIVIVTTEIENS